MFSVEDRQRLQEKIIERARSDARIGAAASVGSSAVGGDRWSDVDLTFCVVDGVAVADVLADWTTFMEVEFGAAVLFDLPVQSTIYRVFLVPGALQVDLSFAPESEFGARGPRFQLIFGETTERPWATPPAAADLFGLGVHHAVRAHICIERGRLWQAQHWIHGVRDQAMTLACQRLGLDTHYGRGFDQLPAEVQNHYLGALVTSLTAPAMRRALAVAAIGLLSEGERVPAGPKVRPMLDEMCRLD
jgi:hypothetical protein